MEYIGSGTGTHDVAISSRRSAYVKKDWFPCRAHCQVRCDRICTYDRLLVWWIVRSVRGNLLHPFSGWRHPAWMQGWPHSSVCICTSIHDCHVREPSSPLRTSAVIALTARNSINRFICINLAVTSSGIQYHVVQMEVNRRFRVACTLHLQGRRINEAGN
jgi:hypothetical protein